MKKVLFLYSRTGAGHTRVACVLAEQLRALDPDCEVVLHDGLASRRRGIALDAPAIYGRLSTDLLPLFDLLYHTFNRAGAVPLHRAVVRAIWGRELARIVDAERPDLVVSTHSFISPGAIGATRHRAPFITVVTDLHGAPLVWFDRRVDRVVLPLPALVERARSCGLPLRKLVVIGYPVDPRFRAAPTPPTGRRILVLGGGVGAGDMLAHVLALRRTLPDMQIAVGCGYNATLRARLVALGDARLEVHGFVDDVHRLMRDADLVVSKPGSCTIVEAALMGKPLVVTRAVGMQERDNVPFVVNNRLGVSCPAPAHLADAVAEVYRHYTTFTGGARVFRHDAHDVALSLRGAGSARGHTPRARPAPTYA